MAENTLREEIGVVASLDNGQVTVHFSRSSACGKCGACGMLSDNSRTMVLTMDDPGSLQIGDHVQLVMQERYFMLSTLLLYAVPLVALVIGVVLGTIIWGDRGQAASAFLGIALAGACYMAYRLLNPRMLRWRKSQIALQKVAGATDIDMTQEEQV